MALTRAFKETVFQRAQRDPKFRKALLTEALNAYLSGDEATGKAVLRDVINATVGFEPLGDQAGRERAIEALAREIRLADALGAARVICWDGRSDDAQQAADAPARLASVIDAARRRSGLSDPPGSSHRRAALRGR